MGPKFPEIEGPLHFRARTDHLPLNLRSAAAHLAICSFTPSKRAASSLTILPAARNSQIDLLFSSHVALRAHARNRIVVLGCSAAPNER
jgi:hypothetical protein